MGDSGEERGETVGKGERVGKKGREEESGDSGEEIMV